MAGERGLAEHLRTGLEQRSAPTLVVLSKKEKLDSLEVVTFRKTARQHVREFGAIFALVACVISLVKMYRGADLSVSLYWIEGGLGFATASYIAPSIVYPLWKIWMQFAHYLGAVMSTILVSAVWAITFLPLGIIFKIFGKKVLDLRFRAPVETYWEDRPERLHDFTLLERQF